MALASGINNGLVTFGINSAFLAVLWYGGTLVLAEQLSVGDLAAFSLYSLFVGGSATGLATAYGDLMYVAAQLSLQPMLLCIALHPLNYLFFFQAGGGSGRPCVFVDTAMHSQK